MFFYHKKNNVFIYVCQLFCKFLFFSWFFFSFVVDFYFSLGWDKISIRKSLNKELICELFGFFEFNRVNRFHFPVNQSKLILFSVSELVSDFSPLYIG